MATIQDSKHRRLEELSVSAARAYVESGLHGIEAEVVVVLDTSPGMAPLYTSGALQDVAAALLALAMKFDDDGVVPVWSFADEAHHRGEIRKQDYAGWIRRHVPPPRPVPPGKPWPTTRYAPFIDAIGRRYFPEEWTLKGTTRLIGDRAKRSVTTWPSVSAPRPCPVLAIVVTAGDCGDVLETTRLLRRASYLPIFWQFAGLSAEQGAERFRFLHGIDKLTDTHVDACGFFEPGDVGDPEALYQGLLNEFPRWMATPAVQAMLTPTRSEEGDEEEAALALLMTLPPVEAARRERDRLERERRRSARAGMAAAEIEQAQAWPTIRTSAETPEEDEPVVRTRHDPGPKRVQIGTRPYMPGDGVAPALPPRRPTMSFAAFVEPTPEPESSEGDDEDTVETAIERLARIRARRSARKSE